MNRSILVAVSLAAAVGAFWLGGCGTIVGPAPAPAVMGAGTVADPVQVPYAAGPMKIDGSPADWAMVGFMPEPFMKPKAAASKPAPSSKPVAAAVAAAIAPASSVKMCWNENGLYGLALVKDKSIKTDSVDPWKGDAVELFIEKDGAHSGEFSDRSVQYVFSPTPEMGEGRCDIKVPQGDKANAGKILCTWKKTTDGYAMEFMIPAAVLAPAKMVAGTKIGLNYAISDDGKAVEQFFSDKNADDGYKTPSSWGTIILKK
jgi:hypothetical protein